MDYEDYEYKVEMMKMLANEEDYECAHWGADNILVEFLEELGYKELVEAWREVGKWYV